MQTLLDTCNTYLSYCEKNKNLADYTLKAYGLDLAQFAAYFGEEHIFEEICKHRLRQFHQFLNDKEYAPATIKRKLNCIQSMFRWLERDDAIAINPFNSIKIEIKSPKKLPKNIPSDLITHIIKTAKLSLGLKMTEQYAIQKIAELITSKRSLNKLTTLLAIELMLCSGMRVGELVKLNLYDINIQQQKIKVMGKGSRERFVFIPDEELATLLQAYKQQRYIVQPSHQGFLVNSRGEPASTQFIRKLIKQITHQAGIELKITPHMFRHSAACELLESDVDIRFVQRLLGHHSISTTELYTHVQDNTLKEKITKANVRRKLMS